MEVISKERRPISEPPYSWPYPSLTQSAGMVDRSSTKGNENELRRQQNARKNKAQDSRKVSTFVYFANNTCSINKVTTLAPWRQKSYQKPIAITEQRPNCGEIHKGGDSWIKRVLFQACNTRYVLYVSEKKEKKKEVKKVCLFSETNSHHGLNQAKRWWPSNLGQRKM